MVSLEWLKSDIFDWDNEHYLQSNHKMALDLPGVLTEKMRDLVLIYNHTAEICFDDKQIYLIAE